MRSLEIKKKAKLILEDGSIYEGYSFGAEKSVSGEVVFNTGMMGYPESMTDPSYKGQILVMTYPLIGNYGVPSEKNDEFGLKENFESDNIQTTGIIISDYSHTPSHWNCEMTLHEWMEKNSIPGIFGVDTRALTKKLRSKGTMIGKIILDEDIDFLDISKINLAKEVSIKEKKGYQSKNEKGKIILVDCGVKNSIIKSFLNRGITVIRVPWDYNFDNEEGFDGVFVSNGPGDPKHCVETINNLSRALEKADKPIMGICLGNQILGLAAGGDTHKLKYGHRSQNQPCIDVNTKKCCITSQNHGYVLDTKNLPDSWEEWFVNANDNTNEGIKHKKLPFFSVQFHPEANPGPLDTSYLFDDYIELVLKWKKKDGKRTK